MVVESNFLSVAVMLVPIRPMGIPSKKVVSATLERLSEGVLLTDCEGARSPENSVLLSLAPWSRGTRNCCYQLILALEGSWACSSVKALENRSST